MCKTTGHSYRLPAKRANIEFPKGTYRVSRQGNISTERLSENSNPFYSFFVTGAMARRRCRPIARKAGKYRVPEGNISSFPPGKHIDKTQARTATPFCTSFMTVATGCAFRHPGGAAARLPALRANIEFPKGTYQVSRQGNISTERLSENSNFFTFHLLRAFLLY